MNSSIDPTLELLLNPHLKTLLSPSPTDVPSPTPTPNPMDETINLIAEALNEEGILTPKVLAYALATTQHETAGTMQPIEEYGGKEQAARLGYGGGYYGRGYIQLTHDSNYRTIGNNIGLGDELVKNPDLALQPKIAARVLANYFKTRGTADAVERGDLNGARNTVNPDAGKIGPIVNRNYQNFIQMPNVLETAKKFIQDPMATITPALKQIGSSFNDITSNLGNSINDITSGIQDKVSSMITPTPAPGMAPTPSPMVTSTPTPTPTPENISVPSFDIQALSLDNLLKKVLSPTSSPTPTSSPMPTATNYPTETPTPTWIPSSTPTSSPMPTRYPSSTPTATPTPTKSVTQSSAIPYGASPYASSLPVSTAKISTPTPNPVPTPTPSYSSSSPAQSRNLPPFPTPNPTPTPSYQSSPGNTFNDIITYLKKIVSYVPSTKSTSSFVPATPAPSSYESTAGTTLGNLLGSFGSPLTSKSSQKEVGSPTAKSLQTVEYKPVTSYKRVTEKKSTSKTSNQGNNQTPTMPSNYTGFWQGTPYVAGKIQTAGGGFTPDGSYSAGYHGGGNSPARSQGGQYGTGANNGPIVNGTMQTGGGGFTPDGSYSAGYHGGGGGFEDRGQWGTGMNMGPMVNGTVQTGGGGFTPDGSYSAGYHGSGEHPEITGESQPGDYKSGSFGPINLPEMSNALKAETWLKSLGDMGYDVSKQLADKAKYTGEISQQFNNGTFDARKFIDTLVNPNPSKTDLLFSTTAQTPTDEVFSKLGGSGFSKLFDTASTQSPENSNTTSNVTNSATSTPNSSAGATTSNAGVSISQNPTYDELVAMMRKIGGKSSNRWGYSY